MVAVLYIGLNPGCRKSDLYHDISHNSSMPKKLDELQKAGVIRIEEDGRGSRLYLTDKGKEIAKHIDGINDAIARARARKAREAQEKKEKEEKERAEAEAAAAADKLGEGFLE